MNEEERRRQQAKENLRILEQQNLDVKKTLQHELESLQSQRVHPVAMHAAFELQTVKLALRLSPSCVSVADGCFLVGSKDGAVVKLSRDGKQLQQVKNRLPGSEQPVPSQNARQKFCQAFQHGHATPVLGIASTDKLVVSLSSQEANIRDLPAMISTAMFLAANSTAMALTPSLLAVGAENSVLIANIPDRVQLCCLIGHVDRITSIQFLTNSTQFISCSIDGTLRLFDYEQQSQLIYIAETPLESCCALSNEWFVTAGESLFLFNRKKRAPAQRLENDLSSSYAQGLFTAVSCVQGHDIVIAAQFGVLSVFKFESEELKLLSRLKVEGFVNDLKCFVENDTFKAVGVCGPERKWDRLEKASGVSKTLFSCELGKIPKRGRFGK